jgi:hypothetical protein
MAQHHQKADLVTAMVTADDILTRFREAARGWRIPPARHLGLVSPTVVSIVLEGGGRAVVGLSSGQVLDVMVAVRDLAPEREVEDAAAI